MNTTDIESGITTKRADELQVGDVGVERDGFLLECIAVTRERGMVVATFKAGMGMRPVMRCRPATKVRVMANPDTRLVL